MAKVLGSPDAGPSTRKCTGPEAVLLGSRARDETSRPGGGGGATGFLVLLVLVWL